MIYRRHLNALSVAKHHLGLLLCMLILQNIFSQYIQHQVDKKNF